jgi:hypothetical protein
MLCDSPAPEFYVPTFRNTVPSSLVKMESHKLNQDYILFNSQLISVAQLRVVLGQLYAAFKISKSVSVTVERSSNICPILRFTSGVVSYKIRVITCDPP